MLVNRSILKFIKRSFTNPKEITMGEFSTTTLQHGVCRISGGSHSPEEFNNISCSKCLLNRFLVNPIKYNSYIYNLHYSYEEVIYEPNFSNENYNENSSWEIHIPDPENKESRICKKFLDGDQNECELWKKCCGKARECCEQQLSYQETPKIGISKF